MKEYMKPKWWLTGVGAIFIIFTLLTYAEIMNAAETGWGANTEETINYTTKAVFYEKAWGATFLLVAIITLVSGQFVEGRAQAILAMTIGGGNILNFIMVFLATGDLNYGYTDDPANWAPPMIMATGLLVSGFLHLDEE